MTKYCKVALPASVEDSQERMTTLFIAEGRNRACNCQISAKQAESPVNRTHLHSNNGHASCFTEALRFRAPHRSSLPAYRWRTRWKHLSAWRSSLAPHKKILIAASRGIARQRWFVVKVYVNHTYQVSPPKVDPGCARKSNAPIL